MSAPDPLAFAHIGDLHLTDAASRNFADLLRIVAQVEVECSPTLDFAFLPGDNADGGLPAQYALARTALRMLSLPVHVITGDHDFTLPGGPAPSGLDSFYGGLGAPRLPHAATVQGVRCLFLDMSGPGTGRLDFQLGAGQLAWLAAELAAAGGPSAVFAHTYPDDLRGEGEAAELVRLLHHHDVPLVEMGHTHYNELSNDGRTVFAAARSTGQIEEGPAGYALVAIDEGRVSWRFRALDDPFPFVLITCPADRRLARDGAPPAAGRAAVRALVFGAGAPREVACRAGDGPWTAMARAPGRRAWAAELDLPPGAVVPVEVRAVDADGRPGLHRVEAAGPGHRPPPRVGRGSDADSVGAWPENGVLGTQLGPNRNGRPWPS